jgi:hypothetical protein
VVIAALLGVTVSGFGAWILTTNHVDRDDVSRMIQAESPYVQDRALLQTLVRKVDLMNDQLVSTREQLSALNALLKQR